MAVQPNTNIMHLDDTLTVRIASWLDLPRSLFPLGISAILITFLRTTHFERKLRYFDKWLKFNRTHVPRQFVRWF
jgi:hypothetical protein